MLCEVPNVKIEVQPTPPPCSLVFATLKLASKGEDGEAKYNQQYKKGDRCLPRIKYFCIAYVYSFNP